MFKSISNVIPNTSINVTYTSDGSHSIDCTYTLQVNGQTKTTPVNVVNGDVVTMIVPAPTAYSSHAFYTYTFDGVQESFAITTKDNFFPIIYPSMLDKYWSDFTPTSHDVTFYSDSTGSVPLSLTSHNAGVSSDTQTLIDPLTNSVYRIDSTGAIQSSYSFPYTPVHITKYLRIDRILRFEGVALKW
jgi:hypothetical protein